MLPITPVTLRRKELALLTYAIMSSKPRLIRIQRNPVLPCSGDTDSVIRKRLCWMKIENEHGSGTIKDKDLVAFMFERDECLRGGEPSDLGLGMVHGRVELIEELVPQEVVVDDVPLTTRVMEGGVVSCARKVEPFRVAEFVTDERQVPLSSQRMCHQSIVHRRNTYDTVRVSFMKLQGVREI